jgi:outer membrane protein
MLYSQNKNHPAHIKEVTMGKKHRFYRRRLLEIFLAGMLAALAFTSTPLMSHAEEKPLTIDECLGIAFENNLDISQAKKAQDEADFNLKRAQGRQYPQVDVDAMSGYMSEVNKMRFGDMTAEVPPLGSVTIPGKDVTISEHEKAELSVGLLQPLYTGGRIEGGIRAATAGFEGASYQIAFVKSQVRSQVLTTFYQLAKSQEFKNISIASRDQILSHLNDAKNLMTQGMLLKSELLPIDIRRLDTELMIVQAENSIAKTKSVLAERMGLPPDSPVEIVADWNRYPPWPIPESLLTSDLTRPEQQIARAQVDAAAAEADIAAGGMKPQVGLTTSGHYGWPGFYITQPEWEPWWQAGVNVSWNIFDMNQRKNEFNAADAKRMRLDQSRQSLDRQIALDRINTRLSYEEAYRKMLIAKEKVISAQEDFNTKQDNFKVGMANNTDFLDAHLELMKAKSELTMLLAEVQIAWADYLRAIGNEEWRQD